MKRLFPMLLPIGLIAAVLLFTAAFGGIFDLRQPPFRIALEVVRTDAAFGYVDITVRNNELRHMTAEAWYALIDPLSGGIAYTSGQVTLALIAPRSDAVVSVPIPEGYTVGDYRIEAGVREVIAYVDQAIEPRLVLEGALLPTGSGIVIRSAELSPSNDGRFHVQAELQFVVETAAQYRYALSLIPVTESTSGDLQPGAEAYRSPFTLLTLAVDQPFEAVFEADTTLDPGQYTLSLWVQAASVGGGFEHFEQITFPRLLEVNP